LLKILLNILFIALIGYVIYAKFFKKPREITKKDEPDRFKKSGSDIMVACEKCGVYTETIDSIAVDGKFYCSKECAGVR
jgi:uncharacterized protein